MSRRYVLFVWTLCLSLVVSLVQRMNFPSSGVHRPSGLPGSAYQDVLAGYLQLSDAKRDAEGGSSITDVTP